MPQTKANASRRMWMTGLVEGWMDGWMGGWMDG